LKAVIDGILRRVVSMLYTSPDMHELRCIRAKKGRMENLATVAPHLATSCYT
jgi:hypothetical protein